MSALRLPRWLHHAFANLFGFFWIPCPRCGRMFGGHERGLGRWHLQNPDETWITCPDCPGDYVGISYHPAGWR